MSAPSGEHVLSGQQGAASQSDVPRPRTMLDYPPPDAALCRTLVDLFSRGAAGRRSE